jgi:glutathione peroxidase
LPITPVARHDARRKAGYGLAAMTRVYDFSAADLYGRAVPLSDFKNQVLLIVNTASHCGFTPQYSGLNDLHKQLAGHGFSVLGFPCNQFGEQEPGDAATIERFCRTIYDIRFPIFSKIAVNGREAHPLYRWLKREARGFLWTQSIKWNFTKFLVDRDGSVVRRIGSLTKPSAIRPRIETLLD